VNAESGITYTTRTDSRGSYWFPSLPVGHYDLDVRHPGFRDYKQTGLTLDVNTALVVDILLQLGAETQQVTVNAGAVQVETANTQKGELIGGTKMTTLPLNGRSYTDLLALQPGVVPVNSGA
jgi:carboxypeptidase family protein